MNLLKKYIFFYFKLIFLLRDYELNYELEVVASIFFIIIFRGFNKFLWYISFLSLYVENIRLLVFLIKNFDYEVILVLYLCCLIGNRIWIIFNRFI